MADENLPHVVIKTSRGEIVVELYENDAPKTVENFLKLAKSNFYQGLRFHRVIDQFVVQGGCPHSKEAGNKRAGTGGPGWQIRCETKGNPRRHELGALSMAHAGKDTGGSQFFIVLNEQNTRHLDNVHTVFGKVVSGIEHVNRIRAWDEFSITEQA